MHSPDDPPEDYPDKLDPEDRAQWEQFVQANQPKRNPVKEDFSTLLDEKSQEIVPEAQITSKNPPAAKVKSPELAKSSPQLDRRTEEKLRKGKIQIDATLDLHGMIQTEAHKALHDFIIASATSRLRCLLVITGKGNALKTSDEWLLPSKGILRQRVPEWLQSGLLSHYVLKFFPAQPRHGGSGALYVYLKKQR